MLSRRWKGVGGFLLLLVAACCTYFPGYYTPSAFFWDENFHIPSAQRYLNGVFFMEPHPPLGKLLIAGGEWLLDANSDDSAFISEEFAKDPPKGFSFAGYRLIPTLCGALVGPILYLLIISLSGSLTLALLVGMLPIFDNALIVHSRGAMLDSPLLLSIITGLLFYSLAHTRSKYTPICLSLFSISFGCAVSTKVNGCILLLFAAHLAVQNRKSISSLTLLLIPSLLIWSSIWWLHYHLAFRIEPNLPGQGLFEVSELFAQKVRSGESRKITALFDWMSESATFSKRYQEGVPPLDYCKEDENGSSPLMWPVGARTINYRWETIGELTRYLYLVPNPINWLMGMLGVLLSASYTCYCIRKEKIRALASDFSFIPLLLLAYLISWLSPYAIPRVFYLYHYFIPLLFSWILFALVAHKFLNPAVKVFLFVIALLSTGSFLWYSPFTYYLPISRNGLESRALFPIWDLRYQNTPSHYLSQCREETSTLRRREESWRLVMGPVEANYIEQGVGAPKQFLDGFQTTTNSRVQFPLNNQFTSLRGEALISSLTSTSAGFFQIKLDGVTVQREELTPADQGKTYKVVLDLAKARVLTFESKHASPESAPIVIEWKNLMLVKEPRENIKNHPEGSGF